MAQITKQSVLDELREQGITNLDQLAERGVQVAKERGVAASGVKVKETEDFTFILCIS